MKCGMCAVGYASVDGASDHNASLDYKRAFPGSRLALVHGGERRSPDVRARRCLCARTAPTFLSIDALLLAAGGFVGTAGEAHVQVFDVAT